MGVFGPPLLTMMILENEGLVVSVISLRIAGSFDVRWVARHLSGRIVHGGGNITTTAALTLGQARLPVAAGELLFLSVRCRTSSVQFGSARCSAVVQQLPTAGDSTPRLLFDLPVAQNYLAQWSATQGAGSVNHPDPIGWIFGADPGVGVDYILVPADFVMTELMWLGFQLTNDATVATRWPAVAPIGGTAGSGNWYSPIGMTAGQQFNLRFAQNLTPANFSAFQIQAAIPGPAVNGSGVRTNVNNLQAGDNIHEITVGFRWRLAPATV